MKFKPNVANTQCQKYQKIGHITRFCSSEDYYQIYAIKHNIKQYICNICNIKEVKCAHTKLKYRNCGERHRANSN